jgi:hypothetical protein
MHEMVTVNAPGDFTFKRHERILSHNETNKRKKCTKEYFVL